uniref:Uncharacterized protein n=1 Tax=Rhizophora mucronata TaxID=61149 RepID=A0A2P2KUB2_RHIMU
MNLKHCCLVILSFYWYSDCLTFESFYHWVIYLRSLVFIQVAGNQIASLYHVCYKDDTRGTE